MNYSSYLKLLPTDRKKTDSFYCVEHNESTIKILSLIFEFKIASSTHIARFFGKEDRDKHIYAKLRRMWQGQLLESFKIFEGSLIAMPVYYTLSKQGIKLLIKKGLYDEWRLKKYPKQDAFLSSIFFKHEACIIELASLESKVVSERLKLKFKGENSLSEYKSRYDSQRDYNVEVFTPDYAVQYRIDDHVIPMMFTEYERTPKSKNGILKKLERYFLHIGWFERKDYVLRMIFETEVMERSFWKTVIEAHNTNSTGSMVCNLKILTTNLSLINASQDFLMSIYATREVLHYANGKMRIMERIKLFRSL